MVVGDEISILADNLYALSYLRKFVERSRLGQLDAGIIQFPKGKAPKKGGE